jgi:hypothetical protein
MEVDDAMMPEGHDWAVMTLPKRVVILVCESIQQQAGVDPAPLNEALRQAG